jgi:hypothetical protein
MSQNNENMTYAFIGEHFQVHIKNLPETIMMNGEPFDIGQKLSEVLAIIDSSKGIISRNDDSPKGASKVALTLLAFLTRGMHQFVCDEKKKDRSDYGSSN